MDVQRQVQALICLKAFDTLCSRAQRPCRIVPLKGIDLMRFLYADTLDRELKDIDLLVLPADHAQDFIQILLADGYRAEFPHALDKAVLDNKKKVSMLAPSERMPNVDVHLALVTKRFFSDTINGFNRDALSRLQPVNEVVSVLDNVDRWLFLAAHLAFHFLEGDKWYRDLALLLERMDGQEITTLLDRTKQYHLERVVGAVCMRMQSNYPDVAKRINSTQLLADQSGKRFIRYMGFIAAHPSRVGHGVRPARYYWEFVFISEPKQQRRAFLSLLLPSIATIQNLYRCRAISAVLMYVPHLLMNMLGVLLFYAQYFIRSSVHDR